MVPEKRARREREYGQGMVLRERVVPVYEQEPEVRVESQIARVCEREVGVILDVRTVRVHEQSKVGVAHEPLLIVAGMEWWCAGADGAEAAHHPVGRLKFDQIKCKFPRQFPRDQLNASIALHLNQDPHVSD